MSQRSVRRRTVEPLSSQPKRIAFVQSCWHRDIVDQSRKAFLSRLKEHGIARRNVDCFEVPGAFEIPGYLSA
jgi:6,7-dimethyl-8-ribityllumazine synthase